MSNSGRSGKAGEVLAAYGLTAQGIVEKVRAALERNGLTVFGRKDRDGWVAYAARF